MTDGIWPDTATLTLTFVRLLKVGVAIDDLPQHASVDTGFTTAYHSTVAPRLTAMEPCC